MTLPLLDVGRETAILGDVLERGAAAESKVVRDAPKGVRESRRTALTPAGIAAPVPDVRDPARGDFPSEWKAFRPVFCTLSGRG